MIYACFGIITISVISGYEYGILPDDIFVEDLADNPNITNYGYLPFPVSPTQNNDNFIDYTHILSITFPNDDYYIMENYEISTNDIIIESQQYIMTDKSPYEQSSISSMIDIGGGIITVIGGGAMMEGNPGMGAKTIFSGIGSIVTGSMTLASGNSEADEMFKEFEEVIDLEIDILNAVYENQALLEENHELLLELGNVLIDEMNYEAWLIQYDQLRYPINYIDAQYDCWNLSLLNSSEIFPDSTCCKFPENSDNCQAQLIDRFLDDGDLLQFHRSILSQTTGVNGDFVQPDLSMLYIYAKYTYDYEVFTDDYEYHDCNLWMDDYANIAYVLQNYLKKSSRLLVWATSQRHGALHPITKQEWIVRSQDLLSYSSFVMGYIPEYIRGVFIPQGNDINSVTHFYDSSDSAQIDHVTIEYRRYHLFAHGTEQEPFSGVAFYDEIYYDDETVKHILWAWQGHDQVKPEQDATFEFRSTDTSDQGKVYSYGIYVNNPVHGTQKTCDGFYWIVYEDENDMRKFCGTFDFSYFILTKSYAEILDTGTFFLRSYETQGAQSMDVSLIQNKYGITGNFDWGCYRGDNVAGVWSAGATCNGNAYELKISLAPVSNENSI